MHGAMPSIDNASFVTVVLFKTDGNVWLVCLIAPSLHDSLTELFQESEAVHWKVVIISNELANTVEHSAAQEPFISLSSWWRPKTELKESKRWT